MPGTLKLKSEAGGSVILAANTTAATDYTVTVPPTSGMMAVIPTTSIAAALTPNTTAPYFSQSGLAGTGPTFSAYQSTAQSSLTSGVITLLQFQTKEWDIGGCFNNTGSTVTLNGISVPQYSFAPNVAGYYQISACASVASSVAYVLLRVYKNGSSFKRLSNTSTATVTGINGSVIVYCNGISDYIQIYCQQGANQQLVNDSESTYFQAVMLRSA